MRHLFFSLALVLVNCVQAQNPAKILAPKYYKTGVPIPSALPVNSSLSPITGHIGYQNQVAKASQNIIVDNQGKIVFFVVDEHIYGRGGVHLGEMIGPSVQENTTSGNTPSPTVDGVISECLVVPLPNSCNTYMLFSTRYAGGTGFFYTGFPTYSKLVVQYDENDNVLPGSGLVELLDPTFNYTGESLNLMNLVNRYQVLGNSQYLYFYPLMAMTKKNNQGNHLFFISNGSDLFRFKVSDQGVSFDNYAVKLHESLNYQLTGSTANPYSTLGATANSRKEMEIVQLVYNETRAESYYRVAIPMEYNWGVQGVSEHGRCVLVCDLNQNGVLVPGTIRVLKYVVGAGFDIKGIEFSQDGSKVYVTHNKVTAYNNALDYFDLDLSGNQLNPIPIIVSGADDFQNSQIETGSTGTILIPTNNRIAQLTNSNTPNYPTNYTYSVASLNNYYAQTPSYMDQIPSNNVRVMQDQIDDFNYSSIQSNSVTAINYNASSTTDLIWTANTSGSTSGNPLTNTTNSTIKILEELIIPAGKTITIQNMRFEFGPNGRIVIENGVGSQQGGRLILDGTTLTSGANCGVNSMWRGVEVWGNSNQVQGSLSSSTQGRLEMKNGSLIENALIGASASKSTRVLTNGFFEYTVDNSGYGGIIYSTSSVFKNNKMDVEIKSYLSPTNANNISYFLSTKFITDGILLNGASVLSQHVALKNVNGILFKACEFENLTPSIYSINARGVGISAESAGFTIDKTNVRSKFKNLSIGVFAYNFTSGTYRVLNTDFTDLLTGINNLSCKNFSIISNNFQLLKFSVQQGISQATGLQLLGCTAYSVEANNFYTNTSIPNPSYPATQHGILVRNSGTANNQIYLNTFSNLYIGGQSENSNGQIATGFAGFYSSGLQWKCNTFSNVSNHDLFVVKGQVRISQGDIVNPSGGVVNTTLGANNVFSSNSSISDHHVRMENSNNQMRYIHLNESNQIPAYFTIHNPPTNNGLTKLFLTSNGNKLRADGKQCPSRQRTILDWKPIFSTSNIVLKSAKNAFENANTNDPNYEILAKNYGSALTETNFLEDEIIRLFEVNNTQSEKDYLDFLSEIVDTNKANKLRFEFYLSKGDTVSAVEILNRANFEQEYLDMATILKDLRLVSDVEKYISTHANISSKLVVLAEQNKDVLVSHQAFGLLNHSNLLHTFIPLEMPDYTRSSNAPLSAENSNESKGFKLFPNPANSSIRLQTISAEKVNARILIFDVTGKVIDTKSMNRAELFIDIQALENGIYLVQITNNDTNEVETIRFVKH